MVLFLNAKSGFACWKLGNIIFALTIVCIIFFENGAGQSMDEDPIITIYKNPQEVNLYQKKIQPLGERQPVFITNCLRLNDTSRSKVKLALSIDPRGNCLHFFEFDCCQGRSRLIQSSQLEILANLTELRLDNMTTIIPRSLSHCHDYDDEYTSDGDPTENPDRDRGSRNRTNNNNRHANDESHLHAPDTIDDPCLCEQSIKNGSTNLLHFQDEHSAIYIPYNQGNDNGIQTFVSLSWAYIKKMYGNFGREGRLYLLFDKLNPLNHKNSQSFYAFNWQNQCRDFITLHRPQGETDSLEQAQKELDIVSSKMSELVEESGRATGRSPVKYLTQDGAYTDIFLYDLYTQMGMEQDAQRIYSSAMEKISNFPKEGTNWFKNWFFPIYNNTKYGGSTYLARFFNLTHDHFDKRNCKLGKARIFQRNFTLGEFIHFSSGAAKTLLKEAAKEAFGIDLYNDEDFLNATINYPEVLKLYTEPEPVTETSTESTTTTTSTTSTTTEQESTAPTTQRPRPTTTAKTTRGYNRKTTTPRRRPLSTIFSTMSTVRMPTIQPIEPL